MIRGEREYPHFLGVILPEKAFQVVRVSRTPVPAGVRESGYLPVRFARAAFQESGGILFPDPLLDAQFQVPFPDGDQPVDIDLVKMAAGETLPAVGIIKSATSVRVYLFELVGGIYRYAVTVLVLALLLDINRVGSKPSGIRGIARRLAMISCSSSFCFSCNLIFCRSLIEFYLLYTTFACSAGARG